MKLTEKEIKLIIEVFKDYEMDLDTNYSSELSSDRKIFLNKLKKAINFTYSSLELKEKEVMNFKEWTKAFEYKETVKGNFVKRGIEYSKESVHSLYYTEYRSPLIT